MTHPLPDSFVMRTDFVGKSSDFQFMENVIIHAVAQQRVKLIPKLMKLYLEAQEQGH